MFGNVPLKERLQDPADERTLQRIWQEIDARLPRNPRRPRAPLIVLTAVALAAVAVAVALVGLRPGGGPLRLAGGGPIPALEASAALSVSFSDGSRVELGRGARLEPLETSATTFSAMLARGSAAFDVRPGGPRRWMIECGLATVEVVGTRFACTREPGRLRVAVERGTVLVKGERVPDRVRRLAAGDAIEIVDAPVETQRALKEPDSARTDIAANTAEPARAPVPAAPAVAAHADIPSSWRDLAARGRHRDAFRLLGTGGVRREARRLGVEDLLALADVARLSGHPADAVGPLERVLADFAADAQAPLAAFALGRLELDTLRWPSRAATAFERALALGVPAGLRADARARLVEAYAQAGDRRRAEDAAAGYAREFPDGRHARAIEGWLAGAANAP